MGAKSSLLVQTYSDYVDALKRGDTANAAQLREALLPMCHEAGQYVASRFSSSYDHIDGDSLHDKVVDKYLEFTDPKWIAENKPIKNFNNFFTTTLVNTMLSKLRSSKRTFSLDEQSSDGGHYESKLLATYDSANESDALRKLIKNELRGFDVGTLETYREYARGLMDSTQESTLQSVADTVRVPIGTVKSRIHRTHFKLRSNKSLETANRETGTQDIAGLYRLVEDLDELIAEKRGQPLPTSPPSTQYTDKIYPGGKSAGKIRE